MKTMFATFLQDRLRMCGVLSACVVAASLASAQSPAVRIASEVQDSEMTVLKGSQHPLANPQYEAGRVPANQRLTGITLAFNRSAAQQAALDALIQAQQDPASPQYHQWLTPEQFGAQFGMAQADLDKVTSWLQQQGFSVDSVNRSHTAIRFSGTAAQVESAFQTQLHYYAVNGEKHFAPSTNLSVPAALGSVVAAVRNLSDFRPRPQFIRPKAAFTSSSSGNTFFAPGDIETAYDVKPLLSSGVNGAGQSIAILGQSAVSLSDIEAFQSAAGLTKKDPATVLVPGSGASIIYSGDESESDLDLEWSGAMAPGANIVFVYTGDSFNNNGVFDSLTYAVDEDLAPILSLSYSSCETTLSATTLNSFEALLSQATSQGQTVIAASGDTGSTGCYGFTNLTTAQQSALAVAYPASSAYVTGMGGTEISASNEVYNGTKGSNWATYWSSSNDANQASLIKYIPEVAWNDSSSQNGLSSSGGGTSTLVARPSWQANVPGISSGSNRLVPDLALYSSPSYPGYLYCTSDTTAWGSGQTGSCGSGFRASGSDTSLTVAGGTSFATPIFAGMVALLNQDLKYTTGQGLINKTLYQLASNSATYASAFHDITSGNNNCTAGTGYCGTTTGGFSAGTGYDEVTGLGSVDLANLAAAWGANTAAGASLIGTTTTVTASNATPSANGSVSFTVTVKGIDGSTPSGSVVLLVDGGGKYQGSGTSQTVTLQSGGTYTFPTSFTVTGMHQVVAQFQSNGTYAASSGTATINISPFTVSPTPASLSVTQGSSGNETVSLTSQNGYIGTVLLAIDFGAADSTLQNLCGGFTNSNSSGFGQVTLAAGATATATLQLDTKASDCASSTGAAQPGKGALRMIRLTSASKATKSGSGGGAAVALGGLLLVGLVGRRSRVVRSMLPLFVLATATFAISACGGGSTSTGTSTSTGGSTATNPPKGTYTGTIMAVDSANGSIAAQPVNFTFVIQ